MLWTRTQYESPMTPFDIFVFGDPLALKLAPPRLGLLTCDEGPASEVRHDIL
jgi:hypothetical protein